MKLQVIGSSSAGNGYILEAGHEALLLEAGVKFREVKIALGFDISKITGLLVTHEHGDHAKYIKEFAKAGIPIIASKGTIDATGVAAGATITAIQGKKERVGNFTILPFRAEHDAAEPLGFLISHPEAGKVLFATDTSSLDRYEFKGLTNILIEANYCQEIADRNIMRGSLDAKRHNRVIRSHMSIDECIAFLNRTDLSETRNIILIHLSDGQSDAGEFKNRVTSQTGKRTWVAEPGISVNLAKTPF